MASYASTGNKPKQVTFRKGASGNPKGRPKKGDSLAECVRKHFPADQRRLAIQSIARLATTKHDENLVRIRAFESLARTGWPHEQKGEVNLELPGAAVVNVVHKHAPSD